jgi:hypothetical protein
MRCEHCGALQLNGDGYCHVCAAPLARGQLRRATLPPAPVVSTRNKWQTRVALAAIAVLLLLCLGLAVAGFGLTALIRWS